MNPAMFIFGFGYTAQFLAQKLAYVDFQIMGTTRNQSKINQENHAVYTLMDFSDAEIEKKLPVATHILMSIPPCGETGDIVLSRYAQLIQRAASGIQWMGYLSSTGVYGNYDGQWVDETASCQPTSKSGILRLEAEREWMSFAKQHKLPLHIFRLAGIYGPQRNALERIRSGKKHSVYKEGQVFSRIHVDDIVAVIMASMQSPNPLSIYNVSDDEPAASHVVDAYAAYLLNKPPLPLIPFADAILSAMERDFYANNRRVSNVKIKKELQVVLQYPSFREGLTRLSEES